MRQKCDGIAQKQVNIQNRLRQLHNEKSKAERMLRDLQVWNSGRFRIKGSGTYRYGAVGSTCTQLGHKSVWLRGRWWP